MNEDDDDDDDLDDLEQGEEEPLTQHLVLAQFDKVISLLSRNDILRLGCCHVLLIPSDQKWKQVTRTKSRWKCTLKDGIMHLNGRDILFNKVS